MSQGIVRAEAARIGAADLLRVLEPLGGTPYATHDRQRRLLASVIRIIGDELFPKKPQGHGAAAGGEAAWTRGENGGGGGANGRMDALVSNEARAAEESAAPPLDSRHAGSGAGSGAGENRPLVDRLEALAIPALGVDRVDLSPRLAQTLSRLLLGDSEKEIATRLRLSPHTVHVYVKALYRKYGVSSRGELLARWVSR